MSLTLKKIARALMYMVKSIACEPCNIREKIKIGVNVVKKRGFSGLLDDLAKNYIISRMNSHTLFTILERDVYRINYFKLRKYIGLDKEVEFSARFYGNHHSKNFPIKLIAFYFFPEIWVSNEDMDYWVKVAGIQPQFLGHYQPRLPSKFGFYREISYDILRDQILLAKRYGIYGFCFVLPLIKGNIRKSIIKKLARYNQLLREEDIDFHFCIGIKRSSDARMSNLVRKPVNSRAKLEPQVSDIFDEIRDLLSMENYVKINGKSLIVLLGEWTPKSIGNVRGGGDLFLILEAHPSSLDYFRGKVDALLYPNPNSISLLDISSSLVLLNPNYRGEVHRYTELVDEALKLYSNSKKEEKIVGSVITSWDSEPLFPDQGKVFIYTQPFGYKFWLNEAIKKSLIKANDDLKLIFIYSWNDWLHGAYLEPDRRFGHLFLESTLRALTEAEKELVIYRKQKIINNFEKNSEIAVILHLFYHDLWEEIKKYLMHIPFDFDLYITTTKEINPHTLNDIKSSFPSIKVLKVPNIGRDIAPFLEVFRNIYGLHYQYICKIHTKKSHIRTGNLWRKAMLDKILGSKTAVKRVISTFDEFNEVGIVAPRGFVVSGWEFMLNNYRWVVKLSELAGIPLEGINFKFVAGTMFWFRPTALQPIIWLPLSFRDFETEGGQQDGTLAHALERFFGLILKVYGYDIVEIGRKKPDFIDILSSGDQ